MVQRKYPGLLDPKARFERLSPYRRELFDIASNYKPGGAEYMALYRAAQALDDACGVIFNQRDFFHGKPYGGFGGPPRE